MGPMLGNNICCTGGNAAQTFWIVKICAAPAKSASRVVHLQDEFASARQFPNKTPPYIRRPHG